jgi:phosphopantetheinyl transferase
MQMSNKNYFKDWDELDHECKIYSVNIDNETLGDHHFAFLLDTLVSEEREKVMQYVFKKDRCRALLSRLLQNFVIREKFGFDSFSIARTREVSSYNIL